ncbi:carboxylesterase/lipase family protein [Paramicrobacterium fandaimingii]|uniref:carboxylesterase/lipase family protein n=1 Tax=Paramicrobacterium fandaimingii TaxID=2708079 RepID=UPI00141E1C87|nr:carboxylesterase family protein [Microbacterium fandaimingii]
MADPVATTDSGQVRGLRLETVIRFAGIPYAAPTAGVNRFRPPQPLTPWSGVRDAVDFGPAALQIVRSGREQEIGRTGEDSLVVNVWTPGLTDSRPVLFWIHGGGFGQGVGHTDVTDGTRLAFEEDVVVVSVNHRLGMFGYLDLEHAAGERFAGSGIAGMLDLERALEWVRDNIAGFGGDPGNVTIFGHSGGAGKVATLLAMPRARELFHRAVMHGGPPFGYSDVDTAADTADRLLHVLGVRHAPQAIAEIPVERLCDAQAELGVGALPGVNGMLFAPVVGSGHFPERPEDALASGAAADIDVMAGTALDEADYALFARPHWLHDDFDIGADDLVGRVASSIDDASGAGALVERYRSHRNARNIDLLCEIMSDQFLVRTRRLVEAKLDGDGGRTYLYVCDVNHGQKIGSFHGVQIPFFFDTVTEASRSMPIAATRENLAHAAEARHAQAEFARHGRPTLNGTPWRAYDRESKAQYVFGESGSALVNDPYRHRHERWRDVAVTSRVDPWARLFA